MYTHVVLFDLHDSNDLSEFKRRLLDMEGRVPALAAIEVGEDDSPSARSCQLCLITRFADRAAYEAYAVDPVHKAFLAWAGPKIAFARKVDWGA